MLQIYAAESKELAARLQSRWQPTGELRDTVARILAEVRENGDEALLRLTRQYDKHPATRIDQLILGREELATAASKVPAEHLALLNSVIKRISDFHSHQLESGFVFSDSSGNRMGQRVRPMARAGLYTPGGRAAYPSSLIMNAVPAKVAGVGSLCVCCPAPHGEIDPLVLAAAAQLQVEQLAMVGGAQAIAALAFGTESIERADKITGPGNSWVAEAKRQVYGQVGLDMLAGPSEILIISDGSVSPELVLADLCAQAEHDSEARALLFTTSESEAQAVQRLAENNRDTWSRKEIISQAFANHGGIVLCRSLQQAVEIANQVAPEHVEILTREPQQLVEQVENAGAIFIGQHSCESFGDYCAGPNHVLPTSGSARFSSPLGVYDFIKRTSLLECSQQGAQQLAKMAAPLAELEQLPQHGLAARLRG